MEGPVNRRNFLARASLLPLGAAVGGGFVGAGQSASAQTPIERTGGPRLKTSLNAYSFNKALNDQLKGRGKGVSLFDLLHICADLNFDAVDPTGYFFPGYPKVPTDKYLNDFKRRAFELGLDISGTGIRNNFAAPDKQSRAEDVRHAKEWIECAARMGAPVLRVFAGPEPAGYTWDQVAEWMADDLKQCAEHGEKYGVLIGLQNHGDMLKTADHVLRILKMVDTRWIGSIVDTGYFLTADPYEDMARVTPHAVNWQVKETLGAQGSGARTDLKKVVRIARAGGYRGYLPIETLAPKGGDYDPLVHVTQLLKDLREAIEQAG